MRKLIYFGLRHDQRGFSMLEMMLVAVLMLSLMTFMASKQASTTHDVKAQNVTDNMEEILQAAGKYVEANYDAILNATATGTDAANWCRFMTDSGTTWATANNTTKHTCAFDAAWLKQGGFLSKDARETNTMGQKWVSIVRQTTDSGGAVTGNLEILVVGAQKVGSGSTSTTSANAKPANPINIESLEKAVVMAGDSAGIVPQETPSGVTAPCQWDTSNATNRYVCGAQGAWKARLSEFVN